MCKKNQKSRWFKFSIPCWYRRETWGQVPPMFEDDGKEGDDNYHEVEAAPEWGDCEISADGPGDGDSAYFMFRPSSHFLSNVQPHLDDLVKSNLDMFVTSSRDIGSSTYSLKQYDVYNDYVKLFEKNMEGFTSKYSKDQLVEAVSRALNTTAMGKESMGTMVLDMIGAISSFEDFCEMMAEEAVSRKVADCKGNGTDSKSNKDGGK